MASITELIELQQHQRGQINQGGGAGAFEILTNIMKEKNDEKRRQENVKKQMSQAQQMMQAMSQMPNSSTAGKAIGTLDDDAQKRRKGVISVSDFVPEQSMSTDENGALNIKMGFRKATPQEQKAQFEMQKSQLDMEKSQAKSDLLSAYVKGEVKEGAILGEMSNLGITADEFDIAAQARQRLQSVPQGIPQGFEETEMNRDQMGNLIPSGIKKVQTPVPMAQPQQAIPQSVQPQATSQEAPFRFKTDKTVAEQKFEADKEETSRKKKLESDMVLDSAKDTLATIGEIEKDLKYFGAAGNIPAFPAEYSKQNWQANVDKLRSKMIVDLMTRMKQASKTGATGFGQLSDKERQVLENAATALRKGLSEEDAQRYLNDIKVMANKVLGNEEQSTAGSGSVPSVGGTFNGEKVISVKRIR